MEKPSAHQHVLDRAVRTVAALALLGFTATGALAGLTVTSLPDAATWPGGNPTIATMLTPQATASVNQPAIDDGQHALTQTFTTGASGFTLDKIQIYVAGAPISGLSLHLFTIAAGGGEADGFVNISGQSDLFNPSNNPDTQLSFNFFGTPNFAYLDFDLTGPSEVTLQPNTKYALELWSPADNSSSMWWRRATASPYPDGNFYNGIGGGAYATSGSGTGQDTSRFAVVGPARDAALALFATTPLPFPLQVDVNGGNSQELHPNQTNWIAWDNLPTSGSNNNGNTPENGYPTPTASKSVAAAGVASGNITATLRSVDIDASSAGNTYLNDNQTLDGRDLGSAGSDLANVYRDFVMARPGDAVTANGNNGTNHRMEIQFTGLDPNTPYAITFYAYDNGNPNSAFVFTDVTNNPLAFIPAAQSNGTLNPGDGTGGTQYAPDGQRILNSPDAPANPQDRAITITATSDATGKIIFDETTVTGLAPPSNSNPVLSGFEIRSDIRSWSGGASTSWTDSANWTNAAVPNGLGQSATFNSAAPSPVTIPAGGVTVGAIQFNGSSYTIAGPGTITLKDASINSTLSFGTSGRTQIRLAATSADQTISAPLQMLRDTQVSVLAPANTLTLSNLQPADVNLTKSGPGTLAVNHLLVNALNLQQGTLRVTPNGTSAGTSKMTSLTLATADASPTLDLTNNDLVIDYAPTAASPLDAVRQLISAGRNNGSWNGQGILSSSAAADPQSRTTLAYAEAATLALTSFSGQSFDNTALLLKYTWYGDVNFSGAIDRDDYALLDRGFAKHPAGAHWTDGDFNYDGSVTPADYQLIDRSFALQSGPLSADFLAARQSQFGPDYVSSLLTSIPEPSITACLFAGSLLTVRRRYCAK